MVFCGIHLLLCSFGSNHVGWWAMENVSWWCKGLVVYENCRYLEPSSKRFCIFVSSDSLATYLEDVE